MNDTAIAVTSRAIPASMSPVDINTQREMFVMPQSLIRMPETMRRTGYGRAWIYRLIAQGRFPKPVKIGSRSIAFVESEIDEWINQRIAESRGTAA